MYLVYKKPLKRCSTCVSYH